MAFLCVFLKFWLSHTVLKDAVRLIRDVRKVTVCVHVCMSSNLGTKFVQNAETVAVIPDNTVPAVRHDVLVL